MNGSAKFIFLGLAIMMGTICGCASTTKVTRTDVTKTIDLSGEWNDTDARMVAEEMINDCLKHPWLGEFNKTSGRDPMVIVGTVVNRSHEHINAQVFTNELERNFTNAQKIKFVASKDERQEIRAEREDQQAGNTNPETISKPGSEAGADYMLKGSINSIKDEVKAKYVIFYQANLELIDLKTNQKKWIGQKEIKKIVERKSFSL